MLSAAIVVPLRLNTGIAIERTTSSSSPSLTA